MSLNERLKILETEVSDERSRLSSDRMDISFGEIINLYKAKELNIRPEYQRLFRWNDEQKTALIESILMGIPIPPIFVSEDSDGVWELIDGLQRVSTILSFFGVLDEDSSNIKLFINDNPDDSEELSESKLGNKWTLTAGNLIKNLKGFNIDSLPRKYSINIRRAVCRVEILRGESNISMKYELFKRLNSGGSVLTPQEIRNAIFRGVDDKLNKLLEELAENEVFKSLTMLSQKKLYEMYDHELILRFIAYYIDFETVNENTENFLDRFMEETVVNQDFDYEGVRKAFNETMIILNKIDDSKLFRNEGNRFVPAHFEGITVSLARNIEKYHDSLNLLTERISILKKDEDFKNFSGSASNSKTRIKKRLKRALEIFG